MFIQPFMQVTGLVEHKFIDKGQGSTLQIAPSNQFNKCNSGIRFFFIYPIVF